MTTPQTTRPQRSNIENRSIRCFVYLEGVDVTARYSAINNVKYNLGNISSMNLVLECPDNDFVTTESDLQIINEARAGGNDSTKLEFGNDFKNAFLQKFALQKVPSYIEEYIRNAAQNNSDPNSLNDPNYLNELLYLYQYGMNDIVIPLNAHVRVFVEIDGTLYHKFCGVVLSRSKTIDINDKKYISLNVCCVLSFLTRTFLLQQSLGVYEPQVFKDTINMLQQKSGGSQTEPTVSAEAPGFLNIQSGTINLYKFSLAGKRDFVHNLVFSVFGEVPKADSYQGFSNGLDQKLQELDAANVKKLEDTSAWSSDDDFAALAKQREVEYIKQQQDHDDLMNRLGFQSYQYGTPEMLQKHNLTFYYNAITPTTTYRNMYAAGLFNLNNMVVGIYGSNSSGLATSIASQGWGSFIKLISSFSDWELYTNDNELRLNDLVTLSALSQAETYSVLSSNAAPIYDELIAAQQDVSASITDPDIAYAVMRIIGTNTRHDGIYAASAGSLKILFPGAIPGTAYDTLWPESIEVPSLETYRQVSRFDMLKQLIEKRTDFVFYSTPRGDIVVEFPMFDYDNFGAVDGFGVPRRSFSKADWRGAWSDNLDESKLFSMSKVAPMVGATRNDSEAVKFYNPIDIEMQGAISMTLWQKIGLKVVDGDPLTCVQAFNVEAARRKADLILTRTNRQSWGGGINIVYQPQFMLNRSVEFWDIGHAGFVNSISSSITKDGDATYNIGVGCLRSYGGRFKDNKRIYDVAFGERTRNIGIDYSLFWVAEEDRLQLPEIQADEMATAINSPLAASNLSQQALGEQTSSTLVGRPKTGNDRNFTAYKKNYQGGSVGINVRNDSVDQLVTKYSKEYNLDSNWMRGLLMSESAFNRNIYYGDGTHVGFGQMGPGATTQAKAMGGSATSLLKYSSEAERVKLMMTDEAGIAGACAYFAWCVQWVRKNKRALSTLGNPLVHAPTINTNPRTFNAIATYGEDGCAVQRYKDGGYIVWGQWNTYNPEDVVRKYLAYKNAYMSHYWYGPPSPATR